MQKFLDHHRDLGESRMIDTDILKQYRYDITKYAEKSKMSILSDLQHPQPVGEG